MRRLKVFQTFRRLRLRSHLHLQSFRAQIVKDQRVPARSLVHNSPGQTDFFVQLFAILRGRFVFRDEVFQLQRDVKLVRVRMPARFLLREDLLDSILRVLRRV